MTAPQHLALLALLTDGRLPAGGHAHSGGMEVAVADGRVGDMASLAGYLSGRLETAGRVDAAIAAAGWAWAERSADPLDASLLDAEAAARMPSPAVRAAARAQGRGLLRVARRCWPAPALEQLAGVAEAGPILPVVIGAAVRAASATGAGPAMAATAALWAAVTGPAWAAVRLLGLDPIAVAAALARLAPAVDAEAELAAVWAEHLGPLAAWVGKLPADGAPVSEIAAEHHRAWEVRLFAS